MPIGILGAVASIGGAAIAANATKKASNAQTQSAQDQIELQKQIYDDTSAKFQPYLDGGNNAWSALLSEMGLGDAPTINGQAFSGYQQSPGYQWQLSQGMDAAQSTAAAKGNLLSGAALQGATQYGQGLAAQDYGTWYNRLSGIASQGQAAAGNQAQAGQQYATNAGNAYGAIGNAQAAGAIGTANAWTGGINNLVGSIGYMNGSQNTGQGNNWLFGGNSWS